MCYKIVTMARMTSKICLVCGKEFMGTAAKMTCSTACRTAMSRIFSDNKKPEYYFIAKGKGQKVPEIKKDTKPTSEIPTKTDNKKVEHKEETGLTSFQIYQRNKLGLK